MRCGLYVCVRDEYSEWGSVFLFLGFLEYEGGFVFVLSFGVSVNLSDFCLSDFILIFIFYLYFNFDYFVCVVVFVVLFFFVCKSEI